MSKIRSKNSKKGYRKRNMGKGRRFRKGSGQLVLFPKSGGFPRKLKMVHRYVESVNITSTGGILGTYVFSTNNMYDPNYTSTGHQPLYYDQMVSIYDHYTVIGAKIKVRALLNGTSNIPTDVCLVVTDSTSLANSNIDQTIEQYRGKSKLVGGLGSHTVYLTSTWSATKNFGPHPLDNEQLRGAGVSGPPEQMYWFICAQSGDKSTTTSINCLVEIEYIAVWNELKDATGS